MQKHTALALISLLMFVSLGQVVAQGSEDYSDYRVLSVETLDLPRLQDFFLSPDGQRIATLERDGVCVYDLQGQQTACGEFPTNTIWTDSVQWSPDSTRIVFHQDFFIRLYEPDIYVMDAQTGTITNLTEDDTDRIRIQEISSITSVDIAPVWSPDSTQIAFLRYASTGEAVLPFIYRTAVIGGEPTLVTPIVAAADRFAIVSLAWAASGEQFAYVIQTPDKDNASNGVWVVDADGANSRQLLQQWGLGEVRYSGDGRYVLTQDLITRNSYAIVWTQSTSILIEVETGKSIPIDQTEGAHAAGFAPNSSAIIYFTRRSQGRETVLKLAAKPGEDGRDLTTEIAVEFGRGWRGIDWVNPNLLIMRDNAREVYLVRLGSADN